MAGLHVLVTQRAERRQLVPHREPDVRRTGEILRHFALERLEYLFLPVAREPPTRAEIGDPELERRLHGTHEIDLLPQAALAFGGVRLRPGAPKIRFRDDRENRDLVQDRVQPWPANPDVDAAFQSVGGSYNFV